MRRTGSAHLERYCLTIAVGERRHDLRPISRGVTIRDILRGKCLPAVWKSVGGLYIGGSPSGHLNEALRVIP